MSKVLLALPGLLLPGLFLGEGSVSSWADGSGQGENKEMLRRYCIRCHGRRKQEGKLDLSAFDVDLPEQSAEVAEKIIHKLRAGMMPPPGSRRPEDAAGIAMAEDLERRLDAAAALDPNPGRRSFQRLNRPEYAAAIHALLDLEIDAAELLPLDAKSANFDNIADAQLLSPTLLDAYMTAAAEVSRQAVGDPKAAVATKTYTNPGYVSQWDRVEGAPRGTRGGISVLHNFIADGQYVFKMAFEHTTTGGFFGQTARGEQLEISINGERVALLEVDRWMHVSDPNGVNMETDPIFVRAGPQRVSAAFLRTFEGPVEDLLSRHEWSLVDRQIGVSGYGITALAHLKDLGVRGPYSPTGVSDTPSRRKIFAPRPNGQKEEEAAARAIIERIGSQAFARPIESEDLDAMLGFFADGRAEAGFDYGIRVALQAILSSPDFLFRFEEPADPTSAKGNYLLSDRSLANRLAYFIWGAPPDQELLGLAESAQLGTEQEMLAQSRRLLADPRSSALATRFAAQWLRLEDLERVHPDRLLFPDYHQQLADSMRRETELLFADLVDRDRSILELLTADYSFLNERLARHYGIAGVRGEAFRRVKVVDPNRQGLLGHGSILTLTSHANRSSAVLRGKWVMEVLLGSPPPPPPPDVPDLDETKAAEAGRMLSVRERLEMHRADQACNSCHRMMDPIGLALENYDVTGRWRTKDQGSLIDASGELYDGTPLNSPQDLRGALLNRKEVLVRNFIRNLLAYAIGRRVEYFDMPAVRRISEEAALHGYSLSSLILGVVRSDAFRMSRSAAGEEIK